MKKLFCLALMVVLTACAGFCAQGERYLNIYHKPSGERVKGVYWEDGRYNKSMLKKLNRLFRDRTTGEIHDIDPALFDLIFSLVANLALPPDTPIELTSGFRSPVRNAELAQKSETVAKKSLHTTGKAADIRIQDVKGKAVAAIAKTMQSGGVSYYPSNGHIHVDTGIVRSWAGK